MKLTAMAKQIDEPKENNVVITATIIERRKQFIGAVILIIYAVLTLLGALNHELWFDESQAWGIARDATINNFADILRHEGHPALWYLILMPFAKLGAPCGILNIISWFFSGLAAGLFMWKAPFGLFMKSAVLFSSGFLFFNSVNSRVYCLIPLLLFLIAIVYPKRDKYAMVYGLLVGLLANTHIMMCGLVGILGIFMIIELFQSVKKNGWSKSARKVAGLVIAGILVLCMAIPLFGAISANSDVQNKKFSTLSVINGITSTLYDTALNLSVEPQWTSVVQYLVSNIIAVIILFIFILGLSYRKTFLFSLVFLFFYTIVVGVLWCENPPRAINFIYTLLTLLWISSLNLDSHNIKYNYKGDSKFFKKIIEAFIKAYNKPEKPISVLLCIVLFYSSISGFFWLFNDYGHDYTLTKQTANFIREQLPDTAILVTPDADGMQFEIYTHGTDVKYYSLTIQEFTTFNPHIYNNGKIDLLKIRKDLENCDDIYFLFSSNKSTECKFSHDKNPIFSSEINNASYIYSSHVEIYKANLCEILIYAKKMQQEEDCRNYTL